MDCVRRTLLSIPLAAAVALTLVADPVFAQRAVPRQSGGSGGRSGPVAVPRPAPATGHFVGGPGPRPGPGYPAHGYPVYGYPRYYGYYPAPYFGFSTGFYPWGWGGFGFGVYFGQHYDPWFYGYPGSPYYFGGVNYAYYGPTYGSMKVNVTPNTAAVYVDGYFAGTAKDLGGSFKELRLEPGTHVVEIKAEGYEPLSLNIRATPSQTIKYSGALKAN